MCACCALLYVAATSTKTASALGGKSAAGSATGSSYEPVHVSRDTASSKLHAHRRVPSSWHIARPAGLISSESARQGSTRGTSASSAGCTRGASPSTASARTQARAAASLRRLMNARPPAAVTSMYCPAAYAMFARVSSMSRAGSGTKDTTWCDRAHDGSEVPSGSLLNGPTGDSL